MDMEKDCARILNGNGTPKDKLPSFAPRGAKGGHVRSAYRRGHDGPEYAMVLVSGTECDAEGTVLPVSELGGLVNARAPEERCVENDLGLV